MKRTYTMRSRAESARATRERIIGAMLELCLNCWYDEITLRELADKSGVALQTVVNHFGTKEGVLTAMLEDPRAEAEFGGSRLQAVPDDIGGAIDLLMRDYEHGGDAVIRFLALESRMPALASLLAFGRTGHRAWLEQTFPSMLASLTGPERERRLVLLICATDVYTWKLLRRDQGLSQSATTAAVMDLVESLRRHGANQGKEVMA